MLQAQSPAGLVVCKEVVSPSYLLVIGYLTWLVIYILQRVLNLCKRISSTAKRLRCGLPYLAGLDRYSKELKEETVERPFATRGFDVYVISWDGNRSELHVVHVTPVLPSRQGR